MNNIINKSEKELIEGLELYLKYNYIDPNYINGDCFDEGAEEAGEYLRGLLIINKPLTEYYYKKIIESEIISNDFFKSLCMSSLLLSELEWKYAFDYLDKNSENLSIPILKEALDYFYCARNDPQAHEVPRALFRKLQSRYENVKNEDDAELYQLDEEYNNFSKAYGL